VRVLLSAVLLSFLVPHLAHGEVRRVAIVGAASGLVPAVDTALSAWAVEVVSVGGESPGGSMPSSGDRAREIANSNTAGAVVWMSVGESDSALWMYDSESDRVMARRLVRPPPFDDPTAAEVALSVKTMLRHSAVAPKRERLAPPPDPGLSERLRVDGMTGIRLHGTGLADPEMRFGFAVLGRLANYLGVYGSLRTGAGLAVDHPDFSGRLNDLGLALGVRGIVPLGRFSLAATAGPSLHISKLEGTLMATSNAATQRRLNPGMDLALHAVAHLSSFHFTLRLESTAAIRRQRYTAAGLEILVLPRAEFEVGLDVGISAF
jgi:hypothetical protein